MLVMFVCCCCLHEQVSRIPRPILNVIEGVKKSTTRKSRKSLGNVDGDSEKTKEKRKERRDSAAGENKPFGELAAVAARVRQASTNAEAISSAEVDQQS